MHTRGGNIWVHPLSTYAWGEGGQLKRRLLYGEEGPMGQCISYTVRILLFLKLAFLVLHFISLFHYLFETNDHFKYQSLLLNSGGPDLFRSSRVGQLITRFWSKFWNFWFHTQVLGENEVYSLNVRLRIQREGGSIFWHFFAYVLHEWIPCLLIINNAFRYTG